METEPLKSSIFLSSVSKKITQSDNSGQTYLHYSHIYVLLMIAAYLYLQFLIDAWMN